MTVFKTFWQIVNKYKGLIILYTVILVSFAGINMTTSDNSMDFSNSKASVYIVNNDVNKGFTKNLIDYISSKNNVSSVDNNEEAIDDAIFYRDIHYLITIPEGYNDNVSKGLNPTISIKKIDNYNSSLIDMQLKRYLKVQDIYLAKSTDDKVVIENINKVLEKETKIEKVSKLDSKVTAREAFYFNFTSYTILAIVVFIICMVVASFKQEAIDKRTIISSMNYKKHNLIILGASSIFAIIVAIVLCLIGLIFIGKSLISMRGLLYIINLFIFTFTALTLALLISSITHNKNALSGIVNVIALGSSFLCGAFVPASMLPNGVLKIAHLLPTYWFINSNETISKLEVFNIDTLSPIISNMFIVFLFGILYIIVNNIVTKRKLKR